MELTKEIFDDFMERLKFHNRGQGVNNHCTADPIFIVQKKELTTGISLDYDPSFFWTNSDGEVELTEVELREELEELKEQGVVVDEFDVDSDDEVTVGKEMIFQRIGYIERWEYVCAHFTREAAEAFISRKKHDYRDLRIWVDSQYWCWEFNAIVKGLLDGKIVFQP